MLCLTDTSLYVYICVKQFGMENFKLKLEKKTAVYTAKYLLMMSSKSARNT